jgi:hypothetical protein
MPTLAAHHFLRSCSRNADARSSPFLQELLAQCRHSQLGVSALASAGFPSSVVGYRSENSGKRCCWYSGCGEISATHRVAD